MTKTLTFLLIFLPLILLGQELKCCETEKEVEELLAGKWKTEQNDKIYIHEYEFNNGKGTFLIYEINKKNERKRDPALVPIIKVIKGKSGFEIENRYKFGVLYVAIKYLDSKKLVIIDDYNRNITLYKTP